MPPARPQSDDERPPGLISRDHPVVARILRRWRLLTGGRATRDADRRTLVACSGGADSVALAFALSLVNPRPVIAHITHDMRPPDEARADRDAVADLAKRLGCDFVEAAASVRDLPGNLEANARQRRYSALADLAKAHDCVCIGTAHHADDQLETLLMRLIRGSGVRGMGGVSPTRDLDGVRIVRPMLDLTRAQIEQFCADANLSWRHDATNDDHAFLRNRVRHALTPVLREIEPDVAARAASLADACRAADEALASAAAAELLPLAEQDAQAWSWKRDDLRPAPSALLAKLLAIYTSEVLGGASADAMTHRAIGACVDAIKSAGTDPSEHRVGPILVSVRANRIVFSPAANPAAHPTEQAP